MKISKVLMSVVMLTSFNAFAESKGIIRVAYNDFPPFEFQDKNTTIGLDAEIVTEVMKRIGYEVKLESYPWKRALQLTEDGEVDAIMSLRKSADRESKYLFADPISFTQNFFFKKKNTKIKATKISDLTNYSVGIAGGYVYDKDFVQSEFPKLEIMTKDSPELANLKKVALGRLDLAVCEINVCTYLINTNKELANLDYVKNIPVGKVEDFYIAFTRKNMERSSQIVKMFNAELAKFISEGKRAELVTKYKLINLK